MCVKSHSLLFPAQSLYGLLIFLDKHVVYIISCMDKIISSQKATKYIFLKFFRLQRGYHCYSPDISQYFLSNIFSQQKSRSLSNLLSFHPLLAFSPFPMLYLLCVYFTITNYVCHPKVLASPSEVHVDSPSLPPASISQSDLW